MSFILDNYEVLKHYAEWRLPDYSDEVDVWEYLNEGLLESSEPVVALNFWQDGDIKHVTAYPLRGSTEDVEDYYRLI